MYPGKPTNQTYLKLVIWWELADTIRTNKIASHYALTSIARRGWNWMVLWRPTKPSRTNTPKRCPLHYKGLEFKRGKSRNTWSNRQIWPEWSRAKVHRVLPGECTGHSKHTLPTRQDKTLHMNITRWSILKSDWLHSLQPRWRSSIQSAKTWLELTGSDHELLIAKFRLKLKKVGKTTTPFRYDLN